MSVVAYRALIHLQGLLLFLFIPLVLYLFLQYPSGVLPSFFIAIGIIVTHRMIASAFFVRHKGSRCFWCGRTGNIRTGVEVKMSKDSTAVQLCAASCSQQAAAFFAFTSKYRALLRVGIFGPLSWYVVTMLLKEANLPVISADWNRFVFQFFIALTVVMISFLYRSAQPIHQPSFPFPIHNLFLIGAKNTLIVFRYVGLWWLAASLWFLFERL